MKNHLNMEVPINFYYYYHYYYYYYYYHFGQFSGCGGDFLTPGRTLGESFLKFEFSIFHNPSINSIPHVFAFHYHRVSTWFFSKVPWLSLTLPRNELQHVHTFFLSLDSRSWKEIQEKTYIISRRFYSCCIFNISIHLPLRYVSVSTPTYDKCASTLHTV